MLVSRCLTGARCRWDGEILSDKVVERFKGWAEVRDVCPEMALGLDVPRPRLWIVAQDGEHRLIQPKTGRDLTEEMMRFARRFLEEAGTIDGFILKSRSPSCGHRDTKIRTSRGRAIARGSGLFAREIVTRFPYAVIEDEERLGERPNLARFVAHAYLLADFRGATETGSWGAMKEFHGRNRELLEAYGQDRASALERALRREDDRPVERLLSEYGGRMLRILEHPPKPDELEPLESKIPLPCDVIRNLLG